MTELELASKLLRAHSGLGWLREQLAAMRRARGWLERDGAANFVLLEGIYRQAEGSGCGEAESLACLAREGREKMAQVPEEQQEFVGGALKSALWRETTRIIAVLEDRESGQREKAARASAEWREASG